MGMDNDFATGYALGQDSNCRNDGWGDGFGGGGLWALLIFAMIFRGGFGGWGGFGGEWGVNSPAGQGALTRADLCSEFNFNNLDNAVRGVQQGLCDGFYAQNTSLLNGFHGVDNAVCQLGYQTQQGFNSLGAQLADCCCTTQRAIDNAMFQAAQGINGIGAKIDSCCCETQRQIERGFCDTNYNLATNTTAIIQNAHNDTDRVIAKLDAMESARKDEKIAALQCENQGLKFAASQAAQNTFITANQEAQTAELIRRLGRDCPVPAYVVPNPNCCYGPGYGYGYGNGYNGNGCSCNSCGC